jgi:hypothetical protein
VSAMQNTLTDLVTTLRANISSSTPNVSSSTPIPLNAQSHLPTYRSEAPWNDSLPRSSPSTQSRGTMPPPRPSPHWPLPPPQSHLDSLPPSRAGSAGPTDILSPEEIINPLGAMSNMAGLVEAAVKRAREEQPGEKPIKKTRFSPPHPAGPAVVETQYLAKGDSTRLHVHAWPDAIAEGLVSEEEGRELFQMYVVLRTR